MRTILWKLWCVYHRMSGAKQERGYTEAVPMNSDDKYGDEYLGPERKKVVFKTVSPGQTVYLAEVTLSPDTGHIVAHMMRPVGKQRATK